MSKNLGRVPTMRRRAATASGSTMWFKMSWFGVAVFRATRRAARAQRERERQKDAQGQREEDCPLEHVSTHSQRKHINHSRLAGRTAESVLATKPRKKTDTERNMNKVGARPSPETRSGALTGKCFLCLCKLVRATVIGQLAAERNRRSSWILREVTHEGRAEFFQTRSELFA